MPRLKNAVPKYRKHKQSGQAIVTLDGRDFLLGPHGTQASKNEYDRLIGEWLQNGRRLKPKPDGGLTLVELIVAYLQFSKGYYRKDGRPTTKYAAIVCALRYVKPLYGRRPARTFSPIALQVVMQRMVADGLSRRVVNQNSGRIKRMFRWGVSQQLIPARIDHALTTVAGLRKGRTEAREAKPVLPVDEATVNATIVYLQDVVADMVKLQRLTGCRPAELCSMQPCDIERMVDPWRYVPESHKTEHHGRERVIFIGPQAQAILLRYLARGEEDYCFRPSDSEAKRRAAQHATRVVPLHYGNRPEPIASASRSAPPATATPPTVTGGPFTGRAIRHFPRRPRLRTTPRSWPPGKALIGGRRIGSAMRRPRRFADGTAWRPLRYFWGHSTADVTQVYAERDYAKK